MVKLLKGHIRLSTILLMVFFALTMTTYVMVRPEPHHVSNSGDPEPTTASRSPSPSGTRSPTAPPSSPVASHAPSPTRTPSSASSPKPASTPAGEPPASDSGD
jgi:hypothetical protein